MIQIDMEMPKSCFDCDKTRQWEKTGKVQCPHIFMPSISTNRDCRPPWCPLKEVPSDEYKRGWTDAIKLALRETTEYYTEDGVFKAIQEESLIGVGMMIEEQQGEDL